MTPEYIEETVKVFIQDLKAKALENGDNLDTFLELLLIYNLPNLLTQTHNNALELAVKEILKVSKEVYIGTTSDLHCNTTNAITAIKKLKK
jgi:hypothetical protein